MQNPESSSPEITVSTPKPVARRLSLAGIVLLVFLAMVGIAAIAGFLSGQQLRTEQEKTLNFSRAEEQYRLALADIDEGNYARASQRLQDIISVIPDFPGAQDKLREVLVGLNATPTPLPTATPIPSPTPDVSHAEQLMTKAEQQFKDQDWSGMVVTLLTLKVDVPTYEPLRADGLIWVALRNYGVELIKNGLLAEGVYYLDLAKNYAPLDSKASERVQWARVFLDYYQSAYYYRSKDLVESLKYFDLVYQNAPGYRARLIKDYADTVVMYGDKLMNDGEYCGAAAQFEFALTLTPDNNEIGYKRDQAIQHNGGTCAPPAPTELPTEEITPESATATP